MQAVKSQPLKTDALSAITPEVQAKLLPWFLKNARDLPWRRNRTPYRVWVSEIMLQQTRVDQVVPYYLRWMKAFPSWKALARSPQSDVLKLWEGLGYYSRARNLHAAAKVIAGEYGGDLSKGWKRSGQPLEVFLKKLPGIGNYTAAAIASLAFNVDAAVVDGNVIRVLSRLFAFGGDTKSATGKKQMQAWADVLLVQGRSGEFNEAMMELGALICLPRSPKCPECPMQRVCSAFAGGFPEKFPVMEKKKKVPHIVVGAAVTTNGKGEVLIAQRKQDDMLGGLWEFPGGKLEPGETIEECIARELEEELGIKTTVGAHLVTVKHAYSHFTMTMYVYFTKIISGRPLPIHCADYVWVKIPALGKYAYSKADLLVVEKLQQDQQG
jgi:A/G-specific adenine glycosylase